MITLMSIFVQGDILCFLGQFIIIFAIRKYFTSMAIITLLFILVLHIVLLTDGCMGVYHGLAHRQERKKELYIQTLKQLMKDMQDDYDNVHKGVFDED